ncbi:hypothetical protein HanXRQr2_Chr01g0039331 [Helianthus annuus]|uniref:Uncharacterized protein n=1 Tax=Helianthus annuus TaxID=4232 RepID=A0A9K3JY56_HELAN|nr:hypothetical protein HanXRQr2_Chr01g0039331 [Helianthus annuus]
MASYGFLLYGSGSYVWYQYLDRCMPKQTTQNIIMKVKKTNFPFYCLNKFIQNDNNLIYDFNLQVVLNQIILSPSVIAVVFAWNNLWQGKLSELPNKYQKHALPTLLFGNHLTCTSKLVINK